MGSQKKYILDKIERMKADEQYRRQLQSRDAAYDGRNMDCERMPFGCWILIALILFFAVGLIMGMFQHHKPV